jgi:hypothetical protein
LPADDRVVPAENISIAERLARWADRVLSR